MVDDKNVNRAPQNAQKENTPGQRRRVLTPERLRHTAVARLGAPLIDVEITEEQFDLHWESTLDEYNRWLPLTKYDIIEGSSSTRNKYNLEDMNKPYGRGINEVRIVSREDFFSPISGVFALGIPHPISHLSPDQYDLALRYINASKKVYSSEPDWEWEEPILWLYAPTGFGGPFAASYQYSQDCVNPEDIPTHDWPWVIDYFSNLVKQAVGMTRRKFGSIPGPSEQQMDGAEMVSEATEALNELKSKIEITSYSRVPPTSLGGIG